MDIKIVEVSSNKELETFIRFPYSLYRGSPYWVPTLDSDERNTLRRDKNAAFEVCEARYWLAYKDGRLAGRIAGILHHKHIEKWGQRYLRFGWIDFIDDRQVVAALMQVVEDWARQEKMSAVHGPLGFTDMDREGMLVEGFDELGTLATTYNHAYYPAHLEALGYTKDIDWFEYEIQLPEKPNETIARLAERVASRYKLRMLQNGTKKDLKRLAPQLFQIYDDEYANLYGTTPLNERQKQAYIKQYFDFVIPEFVPIVLDEHDRMIAFGLALPSLSKGLQKAGGRLLPFGLFHLLSCLKHNDRADLYITAIRSEYQGRAVNAMLMNFMDNAFHKFGIQKIETNPELETNHLVMAQWKLLDKRQHKRRRVYIKKFDEN